MNKKKHGTHPSDSPSALAKIFRIVSAWPRLFLALLTLACLLPFINKAVHIDDTLFLRAAENIQKHPADFYGFTINWFGTPTPMIDAFDNPPLTSYYLAFVGTLFGWSEPVLHLAFLLPAIAVTLGTYSLARNYCGKPLLAGIVAVLTPVFLVSATTLMCDVLLLAFWVWSMVWFERGLQNNRPLPFVVSGVLAALGVWTKFPALALVPLMIACALYRKRAAGWWIAAPIIPLLAAAAYEIITRQLYGRGLLLSAAHYATGARATTDTSLWEQLLTGLVFTGGCFLPALFFAPLLWTRTALRPAVGTIIVCLIALPLTGRYNRLFLPTEGSALNWPLLLQAGLFMAAGVHVLALAAVEFWQRRDAPALSLLLWVGGIFVFATTLNWTISGRSLLVMLPAVAILVARRIERQPASLPHKLLLWPAVAACLLSLLVARADCNIANSNRAAAAQFCVKYLRPGRSVWFDGHWGFQYYMENRDAKALDHAHTAMVRGDILIVPHNSTNARPPDPNTVKLLETLEVFPNRIVTTFNPAVGAGFHASVLGALPYAAGKMEPDVFEVFEVTF